MTHIHKNKLNILVTVILWYSQDITQSKFSCYICSTEDSEFPIFYDIFGQNKIFLKTNECVNMCSWVFWSNFAFHFFFFYLLENAHFLDICIKSILLIREKEVLPPCEEMRNHNRCEIFFGALEFGQGFMVGVRDYIEKGNVCYFRTHTYIYIALYTVW